MVQTNLFKIDLTSPDPNTFKATYWVWISWERSKIQKPVNNRGPCKEGIRVSLCWCDMERMYPCEGCPYLFKQNLLRNPNSFSAPISACWPHYQTHCNCFLVIHQCKVKEIEPEPTSLSNHTNYESSWRTCKEIQTLLLLLLMSSPWLFWLPASRVYESKTSITNQV